MVERIVYDTARIKDGYHYLAIKFLRQSGRPMTTKQLVRKILQEKRVRTKTPDASLRSVISRSPFIVTSGKRSYYKLTAAGKIFSI